jgi:PAS domain S-box-containing protein
VEAALAEHLAGHTAVYETEHRLRHRDGHWVWVLDRGQVLERDEAGRPRRVCGTHLDITARKQAERERLRSQERFRSLMEHTTEGFYLYEPREPIPVDLPVAEQIRRLYQGLIVECNDAQARMYGHERAEDVVGLSLAALHGGDDNPENLAFLRTWIEAGYRLEGALSEETDRDGETVWFSNNVLGIVADGHLVRVWGTQIDMTEVKRAEAEREHLQKQLAQSQKMEAVGRLAGGVAHDFNNMLTVILGNVQLALEEPGIPDALRTSLREVDAAAQRSADLTRQLLAFARKQTVVPQVLDLNETVEGMLKMLRRLIGEDIDLAWMPAPRLGSVRIDPSQIDQILANLCVNARDAIRDVGRVTIETENVTFDAAYCADHPGFRPGDYVQLSVGDDGCGMDAATRDSVFEPFFTTKPSGEGTGLGLSTVYGIVKQNEGFINVYSEPGQGTVFRIYLPRHAAPTAEPAPAAAAPVPTGDETVLMVEDEPAILALGQAMLGSLGYRVVTASSPQEAVARAAEASGAVDLLITDVVLPGMNGRELAMSLGEQHPGLRTLFMSGYTANVIAHHGVLEEGVAFIQKPFSRLELARKVRACLDAPAP